MNRQFCQFSADNEGVVMFIPHEMISFEVVGNPRPLRRPMWSNDHMYNPSHPDEEEFKQAVR